MSGGPDQPRRARGGYLPGADFARILAILGFAFVLRLWYVLVLPGQGKDLLHSDMATYDYTAWQFVQGLPVVGEPGLNGYHPLSASTYYQVGYTYFLAVIYALFGHVPAAARLAQAVVGTLTVGLVYQLGSSCFDRRVGALASLLTAAYLPLVYYAGLLLTETWFIFLQVLALWLWVEAWGPRARPRSVFDAALAFLAGLMAGLACLTRTIFVLGVVAIALGAWCFPPLPMTRAGRSLRLGAFLLGAALMIAPITIRNYQVHGRFVLITTNGPSTFVTGHVLRSTDLPRDVPAGATDVMMAGLHRNRAWRFLAEHGGEYLAAIPECFEQIWTGNDFWPSALTHWDNRPGATEGRLVMTSFRRGSPRFGQITYFPDLVRYSDRLLWCLLGLPFAVLACWFPSATHRRWLVLHLAVIPYLAIPFLAYPFPRYRVPAAPLVFLLAASALLACWDRRVSLRARPPGDQFATPPHGSPIP